MLLYWIRFKLFRENATTNVFFGHIYIAGNELSDELDMGWSLMKAQQADSIDQAT